MNMGHTPGPWKWWTSNSWRRLSSDAGRTNRDGGVICPITQRSDGHPDVLVSEEDMGLIGAAPDLLEAAKMARAVLEKIVDLNGPDIAGLSLVALTHLDTVISKAETPVRR